MGSGKKRQQSGSRNDKKLRKRAIYLKKPKRERRKTGGRRDNRNIKIFKTLWLSERNSNPDFTFLLILSYLFLDSFSDVDKSRLVFSPTGMDSNKNTLIIR